MPTAIEYRVEDTCPTVALRGKLLTGGFPTTAPLPEGSVNVVQFREKINRQTIVLLYGGDPDVRPLLTLCVADYRAEAAAETAQREEEWAQKKAEEAARDQPLLDDMNQKIAALVAQIPAGAVRVTQTQIGSADGDPTYAYEAEGVPFMTFAEREKMIHLGGACAVRPGAWGAFASESVYYITRADMDAILEARAAKAAEQQRASDAAKAATERKREEVTAEAKRTGLPVLLSKAVSLVDGDDDGFYEVGTAVYIQPDGSLKHVSIRRFLG